MFLADKHNFGQQVEKVLRGSDHWYRKPRTLYWEWLFFGNTSPLKSLFNQKGLHSERALADYFFNLDIEIENTWSGFAKEIQSEVLSPTLEHFYAFGALVAYCYIFGIRDLHKQNLVMTKTHFQAVDAEVVFVTLNLPHETLLLPFKHVGYEFAGVGALVNSKDEITQEQIEHLVLGYWDLFDLVSKQTAEIDKTISELDFSKTPSRVIIRNTSEYTNFKNNLPSNALPSEVEQMRRGDIPFYFKFVKDKRLYWLTEKKVAQSEVALGIFQRDTDRHAQHFIDGWCKARASDQYLIQGLLLLLKHFGKNLNLQLSSQAHVNGLKITIKNHTYESK